MFKIAMILALCVVIVSCEKEDMFVETKPGTAGPVITDELVNQVTADMKTKFSEEHAFRIERGVKQVAVFWRDTDGTADDFKKFCDENFVSDEVELENIFITINDNQESMSGHFNKMILDFKFPLHVEMGPINKLQMLFGAYNPAAHTADDMFSNKIAFFIALNFPYYTLEEKNTQGKNWNRKQWAYARVGDIISSRVPGEISLKASEISTKSGQYITDYNIFMGNLIDPSGKVSFPKDMKLISHWNLRDELKSNYSSPEGIDKQNMIYNIMLRIINQEIPQVVINSDKYNWDPIANKVFENGKEITAEREPDTRYAMLLENFNITKEMDAYSPHYPTYIERAFDQSMEMPVERIEQMFKDFISSPLKKDIAEIIKSRLGRDLMPFDIWYDGFKARSTISEEQLDKMTKTKYPNAESFGKDFPTILTKLGFAKDKAEYLSSKIEVDASRGAGHAWGAQMRGEKARLRTRVGGDGMNYKGYNIAMHEFGHNVEQTFSLYNIDYYMMSGVPNTAFTEAMAFMFQQRDLDVLGIKNTSAEKQYVHALDIYWSSFEIMGVSLVDIATWKWLYANPNATPAELREAVTRIAKEIWNEYYADVFGHKDSPILAIYSHMISYPLYLSAYPVGHLIEFQIEQYIKDKNFGAEIERMCSLGRLSPDIWMQTATQQDVSIQPTLDVVQKAVEYFKAGISKK
ncbi:MAG: hypothetical protein IAE98_09735 [Candidatus Kapabacteria bacterium]|nr:hypothetical protein [Candidatus Kapabacteria bacterium]